MTKSSFYFTTLPKIWGVNWLLFGLHPFLFGDNETLGRMLVHDFNPATDLTPVGTVYQRLYGFLMLFPAYLFFTTKDKALLKQLYLFGALVNIVSLIAFAKFVPGRVTASLNGTVAVYCIVNLGVGLGFLE